MAKWKPSRKLKPQKVKVRKRHKLEAVDLLSEVEIAAARSAVRRAFPAVAPQVFLDPNAEAADGARLARQVMTFILVADFGWTKFREHLFGADNRQVTVDGFSTVQRVLARKGATFTAWMARIRADARAGIGPSSI